MYERSGSEFFRATSGMQSEPDTFDESRLVTTFLTSLGVTWILSSFKLVLKGKLHKEIPESSRFELSEKLLLKKFALAEAKDSTSGPLNRGGIADLPLLKTLLTIQQKS